MRRRELARYHDIAATTKTRGQGIGFAGVGIKLGLLVSEQVVTETRRGTHHVATTWALTSRQRAPWRWIPPPGLVPGHGTTVRLKLQNPLSPLLDGGYVENVIRRNFEPLLDGTFGAILARQYPRGVAFWINAARLGPEPRRPADSAPLAVRLARKRIPSAVGYLARHPAALPDDQRGVAISTLGKVIKRGWDWLGLTPATPECVGGLIEVPALAECLTLNKADFIRAGGRGALYLAYRKAIQEAVAAQLGAWGDLPDAGERARRRAARPVERDLESVLAEMAAQFPLLASLVARRAGGQRELRVGRPEASLAPDAPLALIEAIQRVTPLAAPAVREPAGRDRAGEPPAAPAPVDGAAPEPAESAAMLAGITGPTRQATRQPGRYGLTLRFTRRPDDPELARLVEATVWINEAHPAYQRAVASRSEGYHIAVAVALALAAVAVEPAQAHVFVTAFLGTWGAAMERRRRRAGTR
jgi:hypothetical protein